MTVIWSAAARADLARIFEFNWTFSEDRADLVDRTLARSAELVGERPSMGRPTRLAGVREWSVPDIQYVLRYKVADPVEIVRVFSTRENRGIA